AAAHEIPLDVPWYQLDSRSQRVILYGSDRPVRLDRRAWGVSPLTESGDEDGHGADAPRSPVTFTYKGLYPAIDEASRISYEHRVTLMDFIGEKPCSVCGGDRVRDDAAAVRLVGITLPELCRLPLAETL